MQHVNHLPRELLGIVKALGLQTDADEDKAKDGISKAGQPVKNDSTQQHTYASISKQGTSLLQAEVNYVRSFVSGSPSGEEEAEDDEAKRKPDRRETEEESKELQDARRHVKQLQVAAKYASNAADGGAKAVKALKEAEGRV